MHAGIERAPESPAFLRFEFEKCHRQVMARIPLIESLPQRRFDDGADDEIGFGHQVTSSSNKPSPHAGEGKAPDKHAHSPLIPAALMIGHHLSISAFWNAARPSGVCCSRAATSRPSCAKRAFVVGSASACTIAALSLAIASAGVPFGA